MPRKLPSIASLVALLLLALPAAADIPPEKPGCRCGVAGASAEGTLASVLLGGGALLVLATRRRRSR